MAAATTPQPFGPTRIFNVLRAVQETGALKSAIELDLFTAIGSGAATAAAIAPKCNASERGIRILCDTLTTTGLLTKSGDQYSNATDAAQFLDRNSPAYMGDAAGFLCGPELVDGILNHLTEAVRKGGTTLPGEGTVNPDNPMWVSFARHMSPLMSMPARMMAEKLPGSGRMKILDIAAGHGMFGIAIAQRNPDAEVVALDWKAVLEVAKENAGIAGVSSRYSTMPGSAFDVEFGEGYDIVLITNFLHHFDAATNESLLRKVHRALKPGGRAVTLEFVPNDDRVSPQAPARFAITMLIGTNAGDAWTFKELDSMMRNAGFANNQIHLLPTEQSVIISTK